MGIDQRTAGKVLPHLDTTDKGRAACHHHIQRTITDRHSPRVHRLRVGNHRHRSGAALHRYTERRRCVVIEKERRQILPIGDGHSVGEGGIVGANRRVQIGRTGLVGRIAIPQLALSVVPPTPQAALVAVAGKIVGRRLVITAAKHRTEIPVGGASTSATRATRK